MKLDVQVLGKNVATPDRERERDDYVSKYHRDASAADVVSVTMPVREEAWRWPLLGERHQGATKRLRSGYEVTTSHSFRATNAKSPRQTP